MDLLVEGLGDDATEIGLTVERIQNVAESRLRSARIYSEDGVVDDLLAPNVSGHYLYINIAVGRFAYHVTVDLERYLRDSGYGYFVPVTV